MKAKIQNTILVFAITAFAAINLSAANTSKKSSSLKPVTDLVVLDMPYDDGGKVLLKWNVRPTDTAERTYKIYASSISEKAGWVEAVKFSADSHLAKDIKLPFWVWTSSSEEHAVNLEVIKFFPEMNSKTKIYIKLEEILGKKKVSSSIVTTNAKGNWFSLQKKHIRKMSVL